MLRSRPPLCGGPAMLPAPLLWMREFVNSRVAQDLSLPVITGGNFMLLSNVQSRRAFNRRTCCDRIAGAPPVAPAMFEVLESRQLMSASHTLIPPNLINP